MRRKLAAGNWKMNGTRAALPELEAIRRAVTASGPEVLICPPATLLAPAASVASGSMLAIGAQDCHAAASGAHTGDISAPMLVDAGATHAIVGHSERRADHGEDDDTVRAKADAAIRVGLTAIVCIGETLEEREAGRTLDVVGGQLAGSVPDGATGKSLVVAYEPVWAIGTGKVPTLEEIAQVHDDLRARLVARFGEDTGNAIRLLYGGSVKASNAAEIFAITNVDGALVGGASLKAADFVPIIDALAAA